MDTLFFIISKCVGALIQPSTWLILMAGLIPLALTLKRQRLAVTLGWVTFITMITLAVVPVGDLLIQPLERSYPTNPPLTTIDGIIVLGGGEDSESASLWVQPQLGPAADRFTAGLALANRFTEAKVMFTGGSGRLRGAMQNPDSTNSVAEKYFTAQGLSSDRLLLELASRNTTENAKLGYEVAKPKVGETWVLVTSAFHMRRSISSFEAAGWSGLVAYPVDYRSRRFYDGLGWNFNRNIDVLQTAVKEYVGLAAYRLSER